MNSFSCFVEGWCSLHMSLSSSTNLRWPISSLAWSNPRWFSFIAMVQSSLRTDSGGPAAGSDREQLEDVVRQLAEHVAHLLRRNRLAKCREHGRDGSLDLVLAKVRNLARDSPDEFPGAESLRGRTCQQQPRPQLRRQLRCEVVRLTARYPVGER